MRKAECPDFVRRVEAISPAWFRNRIISTRRPDVAPRRGDGRGGSLTLTAATDTTQRWKLELRAAGISVSLYTKVEFSRRDMRDEEYVLEPARSEIVRPYGIPVPTVNHYTARSAIRQKIHALAGRSEPQARDVWDLDHLLRSTGADPRPFPDRLREALPGAIERVISLGYDVFKAQVVPYLSDEDQAIYGTPDAWDRMRELVVERLEEFAS
jgi:hypothetical protein